MVEGAAEVKERRGWRTCQSQTGGQGGLGRIGRNGELKEAKLANAGIGMDGPSRLVLGRSVYLCGAIRSSRQELTRVARPGIRKATKERSTHESKVVECTFV